MENSTRQVRDNRRVFLVRSGAEATKIFKAMLSTAPASPPSSVASSLERFLPTLESMEIRNVTGRDPESVKAGFDLARRSAVDAAKAFISADRSLLQEDAKR